MGPHYGLGLSEREFRQRASFAQVAAPAVRPLLAIHSLKQRAVLRNAILFAVPPSPIKLKVN